MKKSIILSNFGGVDLCDKTNTGNRLRSRYTKNFIPDENGSLIKRGNFKKIGEAKGKVYGYFLYKDYGVIHIGKNLYKISDHNNITLDNLIFSNMAERYSNGFQMGDKLYIQDGNDFYVYDGNVLVSASTIGYIPITYREIDGLTQRVYPEPSNILRKTRRNVFYLSSTHNAYVTDALATNILKVKYISDSDLNKIDGNKSLDTVPGVNIPNTKWSYSSIIGSLVIDSEYLITGKLLVVEFDTEVCDYPEEVIRKSTLYSVFGGKNDSRVFVCGSDIYKNTDFRSDIYNPLYFPADGYTKIGIDSSEIIGYAKLPSSQLVFKRNFGNDYTIYRRTFELTTVYENVLGQSVEKYESLYPIFPAYIGFGCEQCRSIATFDNMVVYGGEGKILAITESGIENRLKVSDVSVKIHKALENCDDIISFSIDRNYYMVLGDLFFVSNAKKYSDTYVDGQFEWYLLDGVDATFFYNVKNELRFADKEGNIYAFSKQGDANEESFDAVLATPYINFSEISDVKYIDKIAISLFAFDDITLTVKAISDKGAEFEKTIEVKAGEFDKTIMIREKIRRVEGLMLEIINSENNRFFGINKIKIDYMTGGKIK